MSADPGAKVNVLGRSGEPDAAKLYAERCVECYGRAGFSPDPENLSNLTVEEAHKELWWGVMMQFTDGLDDQERMVLVPSLLSFNTLARPTRRNSNRTPKGNERIVRSRSSVLTGRI